MQLFTKVCVGWGLAGVEKTWCLAIHNLGASMVTWNDFQKINNIKHYAKQGEKLKKDWAGREKGGWGKGGYCIGEKTKCIVNGGIIK